jgi:GGDEF domain-containing protein
MPTLADRRVLLIAPPCERGPLEAGLQRLSRPGWAVTAVTGLEQARFAAGVQPCAVVLLHELLYPRGPTVSMPLGAPVVVAGRSASLAAVALRRGAAGWVPWPALASPELLGATLESAAAQGEQAHEVGLLGTALRECQGRVDRLVSLLWEATPTEAPTRWFSQRHMLERLDEEVARTRRHGGPLSLALAEVPPAGHHPLADEVHALASWAAGRVGSARRRCDVAGQYGLTGFMLLLPRAATSEAVGCCARLGGLLRQDLPAGLHSAHPCFGVASFAPGSDTAKALLSRAEMHLEQARASATGIVAG